MNLSQKRDETVATAHLNFYQMNQIDVKLCENLNEIAKCVHLSLLLIANRV